MNQTFGTVQSEPDTSQAMGMYCRFCSDVSVAQDDPHNSFLKMVVLFQKNVNVNAAYDSVFAQSRFLDWEHAFLLKNERCYADSTTWVAAMRYVEVDLPEPAMKQLTREFPVFAHFDTCLRRAKISVGPWAFVALYLLTNVSRVQSLHVFEQFFSQCERRDIRQEALIFFSQQANMQFDREDLTAALVALLTRHCRVRADVVMQELELMTARSRELEGLFRQKQMRALIGRPRLRSKLKGREVETSSMFEMDLLHSWCTTIRFPNVFSLIQKKRLYFIMSQVHLDQTHYIRRLLPDRELSKAIVQNPIKTPEVDVLFDCISECKIVNEPFPELHRFRAECFHSFAQEQKTRLRLNDLLHLYIASYQMPTVWKSVWKMVFPVLSIQIIRDVESFVERVPFAHIHVVGLMFNKSHHELDAKISLREDDLLSFMSQDDFDGRSVCGDSVCCDDLASLGPWVSSPGFQAGGVHGALLDADDAGDAVRGAEASVLDAAEEGAGLAAPLPHEVDPAEPVDSDLLVAQLRLIRGLKSGEADHVPHQDARDLPLPLPLHEEPAPEGGVHGAAGPEEEFGRREEHRVNRVNVDEGGVAGFE